MLLGLLKILLWCQELELLYDSLSSEGGWDAFNLRRAFGFLSSAVA